MLKRHFRNALLAGLTLLNLSVTRSLYACSCTAKSGAGCTGDCCTADAGGGCTCANKGVLGCS